MRKYILILFTILLAKLNAQDSWTQKASFGTVRIGASSFVINDKIYVVGGWDYTNFMNDLWEYDPSLDLWTQKTSFPGAARNCGIAFSVGNKGYYGTGNNGTPFSNYLADFWEYDPATNTWLQKSDFPGGARFGAVAFTVNGNGYVSTGDSPSGYLQDLWIYNASNDTWTLKAPFIGSKRRYASCFVIGAKAYVGTGQDGTGNQTTFYEYDCIANTWTQKTSSLANVNVAVGFAVDGKGYIATGYDSPSYSQKVFEYNPIANSWVQRGNYGGGVRSTAIAAVANGKAYVGTGYGNGLHNDLWEYTTPTPTVPVANFQPSSSSFCVGSCINITDLSTGSPDYYTWDFTGASTPSSSVQSPTAICYNTVGTYTISLTVSNPQGTSSISKVVNVVTPPTLTISTTYNPICTGMTCILTGSGASTYTWVSVSSSQSVMVNPSTTTTYTLIGKTNGCAVSKTLSLVVNPRPTINVVGTNTMCIYSCTSLTASGAPNYTWTPGGTNSQVATICPTVNTTYTCWGMAANGCVNTKTVSVSVTNTCQNVWPGDANRDGIANNLDVLELGMHYNATGPARTIQGNNWQGYKANNWTGTISSGKNLNHNDCNGDGMINSNDTLAIFNNYSLTHTFKLSQHSLTSSDMTIVPDQAAVVKGSWGSASIYLGDSLNPITNINGLAFTVNYDNTLLELNNVYLELDSSFVDSTITNLRFRKLDFSNGKLYAATTHTNNTNVNGYGRIGKLHYQISSNLTADDVLSLSISQVTKTDAAHSYSPLTSGSGTLIAMGSSVGFLQMQNGTFVYINPNPASSVVTISGAGDLEKVELLNLTGQILISENTNSKTHQLNLESIANGVYFVKVYNSNKQIIVRKLVIQK